MLDYNEKFGRDAITYDDVLLVPAESSVTPDRVDLATNLTKSIRLSIPLMTAAMDTVTESRMAIAIAREGGMGVVHKNMSIEDQSDNVLRVKRSESGVINEPFYLQGQLRLRSRRTYGEIPHFRRSHLRRGQASGGDTHQPGPAVFKRL